LTPSELIFDLRTLGPGQSSPEALMYTRLLLRYLADHLYDCTLSSGMQLRDLTDLHAFLLELACAAKMEAPELSMQMEQHARRKGDEHA
jgi:hypothetical protein